MARSFNGSTDVISMGTGGGPGDASPWTASAWVYTTSDTQQEVVSKRNDFGNCQFEMNFGPASGGLGLAIVNRNAFWASNTTVSQNTWHHLAVSGTASLGMVVQDGVNQTTASVFNQALAADWASGTGGTQNLQIGKLINEGIIPLAGRIADVAIWNVALTLNEIIALSQGARPLNVRPASLKGYWPLDGIQSPEPDFSGLAINGTLTGTALASGPPVAMFTRRWPRNYDAAAASFVPAWARGSNLPVLGTGNY